MSDKFTVKSFEQTRTDYLRTYREMMILGGVADPDVSPGTETYVRATALSQETSSVGYNLTILAEGVLPDSAQGDDILRHARLVGLGLRPAAGAVGPIVFRTTIASAVAVATGAQLTSPSGLKFKVSSGGSFFDGDEIDIEGIDLGTGTNLPEGTVLRWTTSPAFAAQTAAVGVGGLTEGADAETLEGLRGRVLEAWRAPPQGANPSQIALWAEESSTRVQKAFVHPCFNGAGTVAIVVVRAPTSTDKNRDVDNLTLTSVVKPYLMGRLLEYGEVRISTVETTDSTVSFGISLPSYDTGLGWANESPWPTKASSGYAAVGTVTSSTVFQVDADTPPEPGVSQICWLSPVDWRLYQATVVSYTGSGPYTVTIDKPFTNVATGRLICPQAVNVGSYFDAVLEQFANLGPGEKTAVPGLLPRALRQPLPSRSWPASLGPSVVKFLSAVGDEVLDVQYLYRSVTTPATPFLNSSPPAILVPAGIGFYPL